MVSSTGADARGSPHAPAPACRTWRSGRPSACRGRSAAAPSAAIAVRRAATCSASRRRAAAAHSRRGRARSRARRRSAGARIASSAVGFGIDGDDARRARPRRSSAAARRGVVTQSHSRPNGRPPAGGRRRGAAGARAPARPCAGGAARPSRPRRVACCGTPARRSQVGEPRPVRLAPASSIDRQRQRRIVAQRHQLARDARLRRRARSASSRRLDGFIAGAAASTLSRSPNSLMSCAAFFGPMPGHARHVVDRIADQRLHLDHLVRA